MMIKRGVKRYAHAQFQHFRFPISATNCLKLSTSSTRLSIIHKQILPHVNDKNISTRTSQSQRHDSNRLLSPILPDFQKGNSNMSKFCANLAFMFTNVPLVERYDAARLAGFKAVESGFPYQVPVERVAAARKTAGVQQILINVFTGDVSNGELGFACIPGEEENFKKSIATTIVYAKALGASKIHVMSGKCPPPTAAHDAIYEANLRYAAKLFETENILGLIEPINKYSVPGYYMNSYDKALKVLTNINSPNLRLLLDVFHLQHIQGNITNTIKELKDWIGHVQIAQVPNRNEPDTSGEINYAYVLRALEEAGYDNWIGLEYRPLGDPVEGLRWIDALGYTL